MAISYKKLRHILLDKNMMKKDLEEAAHLTHYQMYKIANVSTHLPMLFLRFVIALGVKADDIMEYVPDDTE